MLERVLFVEPSRLYPVNDIGELTKPRKNVSYPALTVLGSLKSEGIEVDFIDQQADGFEEKKLKTKHLLKIGLSDSVILDKIADYKPTTLLISSTFTTNEQVVIDLSAKVKEAHPDLLVVVGGVHASLKPGWILESGNVDYVVIGEGEETIKKLLTTKIPKSVSGLAYRGKNGIILTPSSLRLINLNRSWALEDVLFRDGEYRYDDESSRRSDLYAHLTKSGWTRDFCLVYSKGCPVHCDYCAASEKDGSIIRHIGADRMFSDFKRLHEQFGVNVFYNQADTFGFHPEDIEFLKSVKEYRKNNPNFVLNNPNAFFTKLFFPKSKGYELNNEILDLLSESGFNVVTIALETFNKRFNRKYNPEIITPKKISDLCLEIRKRGLKNELYMMYAFPRQTQEELAHDEKCADSIQYADKISWYNCMVFPGTRYFEQGLKEGWFTEDSYREILKEKGLFCNSLPIELDFSNIPRNEIEAFRKRKI